MKKKILLLSLFLLITLSFASLCVYALENGVNVNENIIDKEIEVLYDRALGGAIVFSIVVVSWIILFVFLLKPESKAISVNLADRYKEVTLEELESIGINLDEFKLMIFQKFKDIHVAFSNNDYDKLRLNLTNDLYKYYTYEIEELNKKNQKSIMKDFEFLNFKIYQINNIHGKIRLDIYLNVRMLDYVLDMDNNTLVKGNNIEKMDFEFELVFVKNDAGETVYEQYVMSKKTCVNVMSIQNDEKNKDI